MKYLTLNTGAKMPILGFGTHKDYKEECIKTVAEAIECGYRLIDTAKAYENEKEVGEGIRASKINREEIFLTTKLWFKDFEDGYNNACLALKRLNVEYVDLMLLHWPFGNYYKAWRDLERFYKEGKAKAIGVSNFSPGRLVDLISYNEIVPALNQVETNLFCQRINDHIWFEKYNVAHQGYRPLFRRDEYVKNAFIIHLCEKYGKTHTQIALNFITNQNISLIPKTVHRERMIENISIFDFTLTEEETRELILLDRDEPTCGFPEEAWKVEESLNW